MGFSRRALPLACALFAAVSAVSCISLRADDPAKPSPVIAPGAKLEKLADGFKFTEGCASDAAGNVYFTDQPNDRILKWGNAAFPFTENLEYGTEVVLGPGPVKRHAFTRSFLNGGAIRGYGLFEPGRPGLAPGRPPRPARPRALRTRHGVRRAVRNQ